MGAWPRVGAAVVAIALAVVPGALQLVPASRSAIERDEAWPTASAPVEVAGHAESRIGAPSDEIAIVPPDDLVVGELAPSVPAPALFEASHHGPGQVHALIVGIDDYPGGRHDLRSAVADAETIDAALAGFGVPAPNRVVLRDGQASREQVVRAIEALVAQGAPDSTLVLAYSGHVRKLARHTEALVTADGGLISDAELAALLSPSVTGRMWVLLATCFAGGFTEVLAPGRILTGASGADALAYETPSLNASYLVHYLVREGWLRAGAGASVQEAFAYADRRLALEHPERRPVQHDLGAGPLVLGQGDPTTAARWAPQEPSPPPTAPAPAPPPPPPTTTTTEPPRRCLVVLKCSG